MSELKKHRNGEIELLRFVFCFAIICLHGEMKFRGGFLGVEFFYMVTGAFMAKSLSGDDINANESYKITFQKSKNFIIYYIKKIYPFFLPATLIGTILAFLSTRKLYIVLYAFGDLLFLQNFGFPAACATGVVWYLSSLLFGIAILYPVARRYFNVFSVYFCPLIFLLIVGFFIKIYGTIEVPCEWYGVINTGFLRAIADISLGIFVYIISENLRRFNKLLIYRIIFSIMELVFFVLIILYMAFGVESWFVYDGYIVIIMAFALSVALSEISLWNKILSKSFFSSLGKASFFLFLNHYCWFKWLEPALNNIGLIIDNNLFKLLCIEFTIVSSILTWFLGLKLKKIYFFLRTKSNKYENK
ncbi:MAG: acyltransferase family protein [Lachnospiraceae bacterium]|nr:acyltransferase family protein [Lachnospiraceae bacterium]